MTCYIPLLHPREAASLPGLPRFSIFGLYWQ